MLSSVATRMEGRLKREHRRWSGPGGKKETSTWRQARAAARANYSGKQPPRPFRAAGMQTWKHLHLLRGALSDWSELLSRIKTTGTCRIGLSSFQRGSMRPDLRNHHLFKHLRPDGRSQVYLVRPARIGLDEPGHRARCTRPSRASTQSSAGRRSPPLPGTMRTVLWQVSSHLRAISVFRART